MNYIPISDSTSHDLESERIPISAMATNIGLIDITISSKYTNANQSDSCTYTMLPKLIISDAAVANVIMKEKKCQRKINTDENDNKGEKKTPKFHQKRRGKTDGVQ